MDYALSTVGQGATCYISFPNWAFNANINTAGISFIEVEMTFHDYRGTAFGYVLGSSGSTQNALRVDTATGQLQYRTQATNRITSATSAIVLGQKHIFRLEYNKATTTTTMFLDGVEVGAPFVAANNIGWGQIGRFFTSAGTYADLTVFRVSAGGNFATYTDTWDATTAGTSPTGVNWLSTSGTRNLTITNATGATNSWWLFHDPSPPGEAQNHSSGGIVTAVAAATAGTSPVNSQLRSTSGCAEFYTYQQAQSQIVNSQSVITSGLVATICSAIAAASAINGQQLKTDGLVLVHGAAIATTQPINMQSFSSGGVSITIAYGVAITSWFDGTQQQLVKVARVRTSSKFIHAIETNGLYEHAIVKNSRREYQIKTSSEG